MKRFKVYCKSVPRLGRAGTWLYRVPVRTGRGRELQVNPRRRPELKILKMGVGSPRVRVQVFPSGRAARFDGYRLWAASSGTFLANRVAVYRPDPPV